MSAHGELQDAHVFRAGHLFWMPAGSTWLNQDKPRPFALATRCTVDELGTLVYGSTQETEKRSGAACIPVAPARQGLNRNGLRSTTYFYPGTLLPLPHEHLPPYSGFLGGALHEMRSALRTALGIGRGSCLHPATPANSIRGRVVMLAEHLAIDLHTDFAVVLTEPRYSATRNYQIILPIFTTFGRETSSHDLLISSREWLGALPTPIERALLPIPATHSVWHNDDIARETEYVVDDRTLREIDRRLCGYFSLPLPEVEEEGGM
jgi:hypothetical protein